MKINKLRLKDKNKYLVINTNLFDEETSLLDFIASELENGMQILQLNTNNVTTKMLINSGRKIRELCSIYNALLIVNDRIDIAQNIEADGIFLDENSFDIHTAKEYLGENIIVGTNYQSENADYIITNKNCNEISNIICFAKDLNRNNNNKKIIYKKIEENT